jgi:hypothetical protein
MVNETVLQITGNATVRHAGLGPTRYWIAGDFDGGTVTMFAYSPSQEDGIALADPAPLTSNGAFISDDPYLQFTMSGGASADVVVTAITVIDRSRGI